MGMTTVFKTKEAARFSVWDLLQEEKAACFPFPPHHRIPNFVGAKQAAEALFRFEPWASARTLKVNPDAPQRFVRELALKRGTTVLVPTPRLRGGFFRFDPSRIPKEKLREAATLSKGHRWAESVALDEISELDAIVTGSVAVTTSGKRCGKGEGYADLEYAILRELGHPPIPVATTVHELQVVEDFPVDDTDLPLSLVVTPERQISIEPGPKDTARIDWSRLTAERQADMPILANLKNLLAAKHSMETGP